MNEPEKLVVETEFITAAKVRQRIYFPADEEKIPLLLGLLSRSEGARTMVFVNTKVFVERVARALERGGYRVGVLSGDVPQKKRESLLKRFQAGQLELLVATDVAARGLHIDGVSHVYNFDLPFDAEDYVHRIGRTARLGAEGDAISFACERYAMSLPDIEAYIEQKIPVEPVTSELLTSLPRAPRAIPEGGVADGDEEESIGQIFREAREQKAADEERRGGGRKPAAGGRREGGREGGRREGSRREGSRREGPRSGDGKPRTPRPPRDPAAAPAPAVASVAAAAAPAVAASTVPEGERPARKRRRRRHGRPLEGAEGVVAAPAATSGKPAQTPVVQDNSSFLTRLGRKLKSLVSGS
jgi:ATP-dependent RNA helicase RhlB